MLEVTTYWCGCVDDFTTLPSLIQLAAVSCENYVAQTLCSSHSAHLVPGAERYLNETAQQQHYPLATCISS